jgi:nicotinate-nucleotide adenylyltransferase
LGGSFDPPHFGHLFAARQARAAFQLEHVLFVPAARPPHKPGRRLASAADRLAMLALLLADEPNCSLWDVELQRAGPSYTVDTLRELSRLAPAARLYLILGEDNLVDFPRWREAEEIVRLAQPIVVPRRGPPGPALELEPLSGRARAKLELGRLTGACFEASSSQLRAELAAEDLASGELLPPALARYVREHGLYREP